jgi:hypothetical protein
VLAALANFAEPPADPYGEWLSPPDALVVLNDPKVQTARRLDELIARYGNVDTKATALMAEGGSAHGKLYRTDHVRALAARLVNERLSPDAA